MNVAKKLRVNRIVLDSSAVLAVIYAEPGAAKVLPLLHSEDIEPLISAVNLCEVHTRLIRDGLTAEQAKELLAKMEFTIVSFEHFDAYATGPLYRETKALGLSLGDRACLALASREGAAAWTADKVWKRLKTGVEIELIRI